MSVFRGRESLRVCEDQRSTSVGVVGGAVRARGGQAGRSVLIAASARSSVPTFEYPVMPHPAYLDPERRRRRDGANTESSSTKRLGKPFGTTKFSGRSPERQERDVRPSCSIPLDDPLTGTSCAAGGPAQT